jgi:hypothetical protein
VSALGRFDQWAEDLDDELTAIYDPATVAAIDRRGGQPPTPATARRWRGGATAGAMVVGLVSGVERALDDDDDEAIVEIDEEIRDHRLQAVTVHLAWGDPAASVAIVRRWLL